MRHAKAFTDSFANILNGLAAGERVLQLIDEKNEVVDKANAVVIKDFNDSIVFDKVHFAYDTKEVLQDINLEIKKGQTVALVGSSGGGKSTLMDLILRFMDVTAVAVDFEGVDLRDIQQESLRSRVCVLK